MKGTPIVADWANDRLVGLGVIEEVGREMYFACAPSEVNERVLPDVD